jgi:hypothetical protein
MRSALPPPPSRRVRSLRIRAPAHEDVQRASITLTDAFHTASLPAAERGQMLLVRKLALGRISSRATAGTLALQIERVLREARIEAVAFDHPGAANANAVSIPGRAEAIMRLARLHAQRVEAREWFWPSAVPSWTAALSRAEKWLTLIEAAHELPEATRVTAEVMREAVRAGVEDELLGAVRQVQARDWLRREGWSLTGPGKPGTDERLLSSREGAIVHRWRQRWEMSDERLLWLAVTLAVIERPTRVTDSQLPRRAAAWLISEKASAATAFRAKRVKSDDVSLAEKDSPPADLVAAPVLARPAPVKPGDGKRSEPIIAAEIDTVAVCADTPVGSDFVDAESIAPRPETNRMRVLFGDETPFAGLLFLVPVLEQLGFAEFLEAHPALAESDFAARLLLFVGARTGMMPDDPMALVLGELQRFEFRERFALPEAAQALLASPAPRAQIDTPQAAWLTALRRWCRRRARIGLATLVCRPGRIAASLTHLEIYFNLADADLRVRRVALDVDPGWVPWLGRVVHFEYLESHELRG